MNNVVHYCQGRDVTNYILSTLEFFIAILPFNVHVYSGLSDIRFNENLSQDFSNSK